jgi:hypothetical protein
MSNDNEMPNGQARGNELNAEAHQQPDPNLPVDEQDQTYDVAGAALGALAPGEEADLYAAAAVDPEVSARLAAMEAVAAELARLAPVLPMNRGRSAGIRSRLVARAAATHAGRPSPKMSAPEVDQPTVRASKTPPPARRPVAPPSSSTSHSRPTPVHVIPFEPRSPISMGRIFGTVALAAAVLIAAFGIYSWRTRASSGPAATASIGHNSMLEARVAELTASVAQKDSLIAALTGMHTRVIDLVSYPSAEPMGRMFWDQKRQMFIMYASNLKRPPSGMTYQVWLMPHGAAPVSAGTFMPDSTGSAVMSARHPMEPGTLRRVAVTVEPDGGVPAPTGAIVFSGVGLARP